MSGNWSRYARFVAAPLIGVSTSVTIDEYPERAYVNAAYLRAVEQAGGVPMLLAPQLSTAAREALWARLDGLVLTGGGDVEPARFGEAAHSKTALVSADRDALELELVDRALRRRRAVASGGPRRALRSRASTFYRRRRRRARTREKLTASPEKCLGASRRAARALTRARS